MLWRKGECCFDFYLGAKIRQNVLWVGITFCPRRYDVTAHINCKPWTISAFISPSYKFPIMSSLKWSKKGRERVVLSFIEKIKLNILEPCIKIKQRRGNIYLPEPIDCLPSRRLWSLDPSLNIGTFHRHSFQPCQSVTPEKTSKTWF